MEMFFFTVARGPVRRDRWIARVAWRGTGPRPTVKEGFPLQKFDIFCTVRYNILEFTQMPPRRRGLKPKLPMEPARVKADFYVYPQNAVRYATVIGENINATPNTH